MFQHKPPGSLYLSVLTLALAALVYQGDLGGTMGFGSNRSTNVDHHDAPSTSPSSRPADQHEHESHEHAR
jgi:hypothetical protein